MLFKITDFVEKNHQVADFEYRLMAQYYGNASAKGVFNQKLTAKEREFHLECLKKNMMRDNGLYIAYLEEYSAFQRNKFNILHWHTEDPTVLKYRSECASFEYEAFEALCQGRPVKDVVVIREQFIFPY